MDIKWVQLKTKFSCGGSIEFYFEVTWRDTNKTNAQLGAREKELECMKLVMKWQQWANMLTQLQLCQRISPLPTELQTSCRHWSILSSTLQAAIMAWCELQLESENGQILVKTVKLGIKGAWSSPVTPMGQVWPLLHAASARHGTTMMEGRRWPSVGKRS